MAYTYSGNPASSKVDEVHFNLGNTDPGNPIATDEECAFALGKARGNTMLAAALVAESKGLEFLYKPGTMKRGDRTVSYSDMAQHFLTWAKQVRNNVSIATTCLYAGGLSESEHQSALRDRDLPQPFVTKHLHETAGHHAVGADWSRED